MCQKLFKALSMYDLPRDHIISSVVGSKARQSVRLQSPKCSTTCYLHRVVFNFSLRQTKNRSGASCIVCACVHMWWAGCDSFPGEACSIQQQPENL